MTVKSLNEIIPNINWEAVLHSLGLEPEDKGDHYLTICPKCGERECAFYPNEDKGDPRFYCSRRENCRYEEHILAHLNEGTFPEGEAWKEAISKLAECSGGQSELNLNKLLQKSPIQKNKNILKDYWGFLISRFPNSPAEKYLKTRKIDCSITPFGYFPENLKEVSVWAKEKGYSEKELLDCGVLIEGEHGKFPAMYKRLAGAFIDQKGDIHNLWGRDLTGEIPGSAKYLNLKNTESTHKSSPYGAEWFQKGELVWVEGYLDVIAARECGIIAVASGTASIPQAMVDSLRGVESIIIALDKDGAGADGAFRFIEKNTNNESFKLYTINHELMKGCKDIAELYQKHGKEAVQEVFRPDNLEHAFTFAAKHISSKHKQGDAWTPIAKEKALDEAVAFDKKVTASSKIPMLEEYFWRRGIHELLEIDSAALDHYIEDLKQKKETEKIKTQIETYTKSISEKTKENDLQGSFKDIQTLREIINKKQNPYYEIKAYTIDDLEKDLANSNDGMKTGYKSLDEIVRIPSEAITIIGGRPSHGKTTFKLNLFINMIENYPDRNFYFFSYEETRQQIAVKIINIFSQHVFNAAQNLIQLTGYLKGKQTSISAVNEAKEKYQNLVESGRLRIIGDPLFVQDLETTIEKICSDNSVGAVYIDYIQKIKNKERFSTRQLELQKTSEVILETAKNCSIPIILGAQLGRDQISKDKVRLDNLREAGDIEQDANVVLGLFNPLMEKAQEENSPLTDREVGLKITTLKNRNGPVNKTVTLNFDRPLLTIKEKK